MIIRPFEGKLLENVKKIVRKNLGKEVVGGNKICQVNQIKTYEIIIKNGASLRLDLKYPKEITRLQEIASKTIEVPKVVFIDGIYKFSEWIDGVMIIEVLNIDDVFVKSGDLVARLNLIKDPKTGKFLTNSEFSGTNAIWTKDKKVYIVDHGRMRTSSNTDSSVIIILLKRIQTRKRINLFLEGYSKHKDITNIIKGLDARNWKWPPWVKQGKYKKEKNIL